MKRILPVLIRPFFFILDLLVPKKNIFLFTSKAGKTFDGNISALFHYMKDKGRECYFIKDPFSIQSFKLSLRAKTVFLSHGVGDLPYALHSFRKNVVYLGHGITIKKMLFEDESLSFKRLIFSGLESRFYSHVIASSQADKENLSRVFRLSKERIYVTGLPRNDFLKSPKSLKLALNKEGRFVLYAPTYRPGKAAQLFPFMDKNLDELNNFLKSTNTFLVIRLHPNDLLQDDNVFSYSNIIKGDRSVLNDIQEYLFDFSSIITDYSSIYIDYLLSDRPVAFIPYDLDEYIRTTGLFFNYKDVTPGPHLGTQNDLIQFLSSLEDDGYALERKRVREIFYEHNDFDSCERVLRLFN